MNLLVTHTRVKNNRPHGPNHPTKNGDGQKDTTTLLSASIFKPVFLADVITGPSNGTTSQTKGLDAKAQVGVCVGGLRATHTLGMDILQHILTQVITVQGKVNVVFNEKMENKPNKRKENPKKNDRKKEKKKRKKEKQTQQAICLQGFPFDGCQRNRTDSSNSRAKRGGIGKGR